MGAPSNCAMPVKILKLTKLLLKLLPREVRRVQVQLKFAGVPSFTKQTSFVLSIYWWLFAIYLCTFLKPFIIWINIIFCQTLKTVGSPNLSDSKKILHLFLRYFGTCKCFEGFFDWTIIIFVQVTDAVPKRFLFFGFVLKAA